MFKIQIFISAISVLLFIITVMLIKKRRLKEEYAIIWIIAEGMLFVFGIFPGLLGTISEIIGVYYLTALFIVSFVFLFIVAFYNSIILSRLSEMNAVLIQEVALLKSKYEGRK
jgi:hypothetical protein